MRQIIVFVERVHLKMVKLEMVEMLPKIRAAFDNRELQMFNYDDEDKGCLYQGPCAIGVCLPENVRAEFDNREETGICVILDEPDLVDYNEEERCDIIDLQACHDSVYSQRGLRTSDDFEQFLVHLEQKYLTI